MPRQPDPLAAMIAANMREHAQGGGLDLIGRPATVEDRFSRTDENYHLRTLVIDAEPVMPTKWKIE